MLSPESSSGVQYVDSPPDGVATRGHKSTSAPHVQPSVERCALV